MLLFYLPPFVSLLSEFVSLELHADSCEFESAFPVFFVLLTTVFPPKMTARPSRREHNPFRNSGEMSICALIVIAAPCLSNLSVSLTIQTFVISVYNIACCKSSLFPQSPHMRGTCKAPLHKRITPAPAGLFYGSTSLPLPHLRPLRVARHIRERVPDAQHFGPIVHRLVVGLRLSPTRLQHGLCGVHVFAGQSAEV